MRKDKNVYPTWVCFECAQKVGGKFPEGHLATWHIDICDVCKETKSVTEPRDFGYPDFTKAKKM